MNDTSNDMYKEYIEAKNFNNATLLKAKKATELFLK